METKSNIIATVIFTAFLLCCFNTAQAQDASKKLIASMQQIRTSASLQGMRVVSTISNVSLDKTTLLYRNTAITEAPSGTLKIEADYSIPLNALPKTSSHLEDKGLGVVKLLIEVMGAGEPFAITERKYTTGVYANDIKQGEAKEIKDSLIGFPFSTKKEAEDFQKVWNKFVDSLQKDIR